MQRVKHILRYFSILAVLAVILGITANTNAMDKPPASKPVILTDQVTPREIPQEGNGNNIIAPLSAPPLVMDAPKIFRPIYQTQPPIKIALLLPLTGAYADLGNALLDAAQLAVFDIDSPNLTLLPIDTKGTVLGATRAAKEAADEGAKLILGPVFSSSARAVAPIGFKNDINIISFSNDEALLKEGIFLLGFSPKQQIRRVVDYAVSQGITVFSAIVPNNGYGAMISESLRNQVSKEEGYIKNVEFYLPDKTNIVGNINRSVAGLIRAGKSQETKASTNETAQATGDSTLKGLLIPEGANRLRNIISHLENYNLDGHRIRLLGSGQWDDTSLTQVERLHGAWFASAPPEQRQRFEEHFHSTYGYVPVKLASLAYDGVALAATLATIQNGGDFSHNALTSKRGFVGVDGIFRLHSDGMTERGLAVMEITPNGFRVIDPAPDSFVDLNSGTH